MGARFTHYGSYHEFAVVITDKEHPVTKGVDDFRISDELYVLGREPKDAQILATAEWEGKLQPIITQGNLVMATSFIMRLGMMRKPLIIQPIAN